MRLGTFLIALGVGISVLAAATDAQAHRRHYRHVHKVYHVHERCDLVVAPRAVLTRDGFRWRRVYACRTWS